MNIKLEREHLPRIIEIEENRKEAREVLEKDYRSYHADTQRNYKGTKQNLEATSISKVIRKLTEIRKEEEKEIEEDIQEKSAKFTTMKPTTIRGYDTQHSSRSYLGGDFQNSGSLSKIIITQEQKERMIEQIVSMCQSVKPIKRRSDHEEDCRLINSMIPGKKKSEYPENKLSNTTEKEEKIIDLTSTKDEEEVQMEEIRQEKGELNQQNEQLHGAMSAFKAVDKGLYVIIPPK